MKGIILAGGRATRLRPLTKITSKQLLPVYDKPMIFYPIETLKMSGITEILIIVAPEYAGHFLNLLGSGRDFGLNFTYEIQEEPKGIADAFRIGESFIGKDNVALILGDNIFDEDFSQSVASFKKGGKVFAKKVHDPKRFGVVEFDETGKAKSIEEKPNIPKSDYAVVGLYLYDNRVVQYAKELIPSDRGEIEITDIHNRYLRDGELEVETINSIWMDAGTFDSLYDANRYWAEKKRTDNF